LTGNDRESTMEPLAAILDCWAEESKGGSFSAAVEPRYRQLFSETSHYALPRFTVRDTPGEPAGMAGEEGTPESLPAESPHSGELRGDTLSATDVLDRWMRRDPLWRRCVFTGSPGAGKTLWLRYAAHAVAGRQAESRSTELIPVLMPLQELRSARTVEDVKAAVFARFALPTNFFPNIEYARQYAHKGSSADRAGKEGEPAEQRRAETMEQFRACLESDRVILLLDGWDEVRKGEWVSCLEQFLPTGWTVAVNSRPGHIHEIARTISGTDGAATVLAVQPMSRGDQQQLNGGAPLSAGPELTDALRNPLLLSVALRLPEGIRHDLGYSDVQFYDRLVEQLLGRPKIGGKTKKDDGLVRQVLERIAWHEFVLWESTEIDKEMLREHCTAVLYNFSTARAGKVARLLPRVVDSGLIPQTDERENSHRFLHRCLLEYFAAGFLLRSGDAALEEIREHLLCEPRWWRVLRYYAGLVARPRAAEGEEGGADRAGELFDLIADWEDPLGEHLPYRKGYLAGLVACELWPVLAEGRRKTARTLVELGRIGEARDLFADSEDLFLSGAPFLARVDRSYSIEALESRDYRVLLAAGGPIVCETILEALSETGPIEETEPLLVLLVHLAPPGADKAVADIMTSSPAPEVRACAAAALGLLNAIEEGPRARLEARLNDTSTSVRVEAALALGRIGGEGTVKPLLECLAATTSLAVRRAAIRSLRMKGSALAKEALTGVTDQDEVEETEYEAAMELEQLLGLLEDSGPKVRRQAVERLGRMKAFPSLESLASMADEEPSESVRVAIARALGELAGDRAVTPLARLLNDSDDLASEAAALALGRIGGRKSMAHLMTALDGTEPTLSLSAALGLLRMLPSLTAGEQEAVKRRVVETHLAEPESPVEVSTGHARLLFVRIVRSLFFADAGE